MDRIFILYRESIPQLKRIVERIKKRYPTINTISAFDRPDLAKRFMRHFPVFVIKDNDRFLTKTITNAHNLDNLEKITLSAIEFVEEKSPLRFKVLDETLYWELVKNALFLFDPMHGGFFEEEIKTPRVDALLSTLSIWVTEKEIRARKIVEDTVNIILNTPVFDRNLNLINSGSFSLSWDIPTEEYLFEDNALFVILLLNMAKSIPNKKYEEVAIKIFKSIKENFIIEDLTIPAIYKEKERTRKVEKTNIGLVAVFISLCTHIYRVSRDKNLIEKSSKLLNKIFKSSEYTKKELTLEDLANTIEATLDLYTVTGDQSFVEKAKKLYSETENLFLDKSNYLFNDTLDKSLPFRYAIKETSKLVKSLARIGTIEEKDIYKEKAKKLLLEIAKISVDKGVEGLVATIPIILVLFGPIDIRITGSDEKLVETAINFITPISTVSYRKGTENFVEVCFANKCFERAKTPELLRDQLVSILISGLG
ncbi:MAG: hypothetical protein ACPLSJ_00805 [Thermosulfidibacteraceae bacterium]|jgi:uncharacterized protein YyaL (SSP411 family)